MEDRLRALLRDIAGEAPASADPPPDLGSRARRRMARSAGILLLALVVLAAGSVALVRAVGSTVPAPEVPRPGAGSAAASVEPPLQLSPPPPELTPGAVATRLGNVRPGLDTAHELAFFSDREVNQLWEIYVVDPQGGNQQRLTGEPLYLGGAYRLSWSPDGSRLALDVGLGEGHGALDVIDLTNGERTRLVEDRTGNNPQGPVWSPDGTRIAFSTGYGDLHVVSADGSHLTPITSSRGGHHGDPAWSPDASRLAFSCDCRADSGIYLVNADGSGMTRIVEGRASQPAWSPDGQRIAFQRDGQIHVVAADGSGEVAVTTTPENADPAWSPDGTEIAFTSNRDGNNEIYVMAADGTGERRLTDDAATDFAPAWRPS